MPTKITTRALPDNTYVITTAFTDDDGDAVTPNAGLIWSLKDTKGTAINSRTDIDMTEAASIDTVLSGDDLATTGFNDDGMRLFILSGTYDGTSGNDLPLDEVSVFIINDVTLPITLQDAKDHLRIDSDITASDLYVLGLIEAATEAAEDYMRRKLVTQTVVKYFYAWPAVGFRLPYGNLQSVTTIKYTDYEENQSTLADTEYLVDTNTPDLVGRVILAYNKTWPTDTLSKKSPIEITYVCGYGLTKAHVPMRARQAIMIEISDRFENREDLFTGPGLVQLKNDAARNYLFPLRLEVF